MHCTSTLALYFRDRVGCGLMDARAALEKCKSLESAVTYILIKGDGTARFRIAEDGSRIRWTDQDYIDYANEHPSDRIDFSEE